MKRITALALALGAALPATAAPKPGIWHGAFPGDLWRGQSPAEINRVIGRFESLAGQKLALVNFFIGVDDGRFPTTVCETIARRGTLPMISLSPGNVPLEAYLNGSQDERLDRFAREAAAWGKPFLLRWAWEMNGGSYGWTGLRAGGPGRGPQRYVATWRRLHARFAALGARNAQWVWCPDAWGLGPVYLGQLTRWNAPANYWPGAEQVDWIGIDGYNWPHQTPHPFVEIFDHPQLAHSLLSWAGQWHKPTLIAEFASAQSDPQSPAWIRDAYRSARRYPHLKAMVWFNKDQDRAEWALQPGTPATRAYRQSVQSLLGRAR